MKHEICYLAAMNFQFELVCDDCFECIDVALEHLAKEMADRARKSMEQVIGGMAQTP